jgi:hypothetical protein
MKKKYVILGCPRSGTGYASMLFKYNNIQVNHEILGSDGISSWCLFPSLPDSKLYGPSLNEVINEFNMDSIEFIHLHRHPLNVISSLQTISNTSWNYINKCLNLSPELDKLTRSIEFWVNWNLSIENITSNLISIEDLSTHYKLNIYPNKKYNSRAAQYENFNINQLKESNSFPKLKKLSKKYGYVL